MDYFINQVNALGRVIVSVLTFPKRSVTVISSVDVGLDAVTLNMWAVVPVTNELVGVAPTFSLLAS